MRHSSIFRERAKQHVEHKELETQGDDRKLKMQEKLLAVSGCAALLEHAKAGRIRTSTYRLPS